MESALYYVYVLPVSENLTKPKLENNFKLAITDKGSYS